MGRKYETTPVVDTKLANKEVKFPDPLPGQVPFSVGVVEVREEFPGGSFLMQGYAYIIAGITTIKPEDVTGTFIQVPKQAKRPFKVTQNGIDLKYMYIEKEGIYTMENGSWVLIKNSTVAANLVGPPDIIKDGEEKKPEDPEKEKQKKEYTAGDPVLEVGEDSIRLAPLLPASNNRVKGFDNEYYELKPYVNVSFNTMSGWTKTEQLYSNIDIRCYYEGQNPMLYHGWAILWPFTSTVVAQLTNRNNNIAENFTLQGATLRNADATEKNGIVYIKGYEFNKIVYNATILGHEPLYMKKLERLMGSKDLALQFLSLGQEALVTKPVVDIADPNIPNTDPIIKKEEITPNSGGDTRTGGPRPGHSNNLYEYLMKMDTELKSRTVLVQEKSTFGKSDLVPPNTEILHKVPEKTFVQKYGVAVLGIVAAGFGAAYYGRNRSDFIDDDFEREHAKSQEDIRDLTKESKKIETAAIQKYQEGAQGLEAANEIQEANQGAIDTLENKELEPEEREAHETLEEARHDLNVVDDRINEIHEEQQSSVPDEKIYEELIIAELDKQEAQAVLDDAAEEFKETDDEVHSETIEINE